MILGIGINGKHHTLAFLHATDVSLVDVGNDAHVGQILCNSKKFRRVERSGNGLAFLHSLRQHDAVNRAGDSGVAKVGLCLLHTLARRVHLLLSLEVGELGRLEIVGADKAFIVQCLVALVVGQLEIQRTLRTGQVGTGGVQLAGEVGPVKLGNHLSFLYYAIVVDIEMADDTRNLRTYGDAGHRLNGAGSGDAALNVGAFHFGLLKLYLLLTGAFEEEKIGCHDGGDNHDSDDDFLFHILLN